MIKLFRTVCIYFLKYLDFYISNNYNVFYNYIYKTLKNNIIYILMSNYNIDYEKEYIIKINDMITQSKFILPSESPYIAFSNIFYDYTNKEINIHFSFLDNNKWKTNIDSNILETIDYFVINVSDKSRNWNYIKATSNWSENIHDYFHHISSNIITMNIPCNLFLLRTKTNTIKIKYIDNINIYYVSILPIYNNILSLPSEELFIKIKSLNYLTVDELYINYRHIGLYYSNWAINYCTYNNNFKIFEELIQYFKKNLSYFNIVDILNINKQANGINIAFRCDIDCDIVTAIKMSNYFKSQEILATFYLLHTSYYYRQNNKYPILRCDDLKDNILQIHNDYCSIGLHLDPLEVYINLNGDGTNEVNNEIIWLRNIVSINSVCAHNSYLVYGAENFEIFQSLSYENRKFFTYQNKTIPLATISLEELNLQEINYPIIKKNNTIIIKDCSNNCNKEKNFKEAIFDNKIFKHGYNINIWCIGKDEWVISNYEKNYFNITNFTNVLTYLDTLKKKYNTLKKYNTIVFNLHPIYFSKNS